MGALDSVPKALLLGVSLALALVVAGLLVHITVKSQEEPSDAVPTINAAAQSQQQCECPMDSDKDSSNATAAGLPPPSVVVDNRLFNFRTSQLGIYGEAGVATPADKCAQIGADAMSRGGTVVDGAIASLFCNGAVHSMMMGIGGGFIMTIYIKEENKVYSLVSREMAPAASNSTMFVGRPELSRSGPLAPAIPGEILGYDEAKKRFGNPAVSWASLIEPTIKLCEEGLPVTETLHEALRKMGKKIFDEPEWRNTFVDPTTNELYKIGETYKRPVFAQTLRRIAKNGPMEFYTGQTAKDLINDIQELGGILTMEDMASFKSRWDEPVTTTLANGMKMYSSPPPGSGSVTAGILSILSNFDFKREDADNPVSYHRFAEACKWGFAKRTLMGDWADEEIREGIEELVAELTNPEWGRTTRHKIRDDWTSQDTDFYGADFVPAEDGGTTHISLQGPNGDAVAVTSTINTLFGSGVMSNSTGIIMNNQMDDFSTPGSPNSWGISPSPTNFIKPGRRPVSSMSPTIIVDTDGTVKIVLGAAGGPKIISGTAFVAWNNIWFKKNIKESIDAPRIHHQLLPMNVRVEPDVHPGILKYLTSVGHKLDIMAPGEYLSTVQGISIEGQGRVVTVNNDKRRTGQVAGF